MGREWAGREVRAWGINVCLNLKPVSPGTHVGWKYPPCVPARIKHTCFTVLIVKFWFCNSVGHYYVCGEHLCIHPDCFGSKNEDAAEDSRLCRQWKQPPSHNPAEVPW